MRYQTISAISNNQCDIKHSILTDTDGCEQFDGENRRVTGGEERLQGVVRKGQCHDGLGCRSDDDEVHLEHAQIVSSVPHASVPQGQPIKSKSMCIFRPLFQSGLKCQHTSPRKSDIII